ncbi:DEHA2G10252p [Debaryomyces hansenii CBS767]|uniref:Vesicular-fusion protein SEC18 n=1 Tax=Debaryomyces hansenii (strain ATCC 36239 / CBS 767 / BCRC 21394 / JCM 1990 / NBRC 0083 / IGC 2968) TaxID=284592 RepID=B5RUP7_DEBHA|nr:DEHA2G10252p [Debaryomyces hansenii CBS767]CAR65941.1 DEHA2G10252p [Debaryomyces hansenii CBS767]|eukprot:XP_002770606.1 DEHA2G10252p [Debaryomyces hansenii CBS767]
MEKLGFHKVSNHPGPGNPLITHNQPIVPERKAPVRHFQKQFKVDNCPSNAVALSNCIGVNPRDFQEMGNREPVILDGNFVYSIYKDESVAPGVVGLAGNMRSWGKWSLHQPVVVEPFNIFDGNKQSYLGSVDLVVDFRSRSKAHSAPINHDELVQHFLKMYENQILQPTQSIVMDFKANIFLVTVTGIQVLDINNLGDVPNLQTLSDLNAKGILIKQTQLNMYPQEGSSINIAAASGSRQLRKPQGKPIINPDFKLEQMGIGGLDEEFSQIFRRAFASRIISPDLVEKLALRHVKGLLLFGPPGTGKTLIARQIGKMLNVKEPKVVNGPEMLSKYVGASEENIRKLFSDAETEYKQKGENSQLHIIIFDELDSVFKQRGSAKSDGTGVGDNVVNQLLAKMDGVDQLNNILIIGMTNRLDLIDNALLRPGRFEIQIEISLPDEKGRKDILLIHTKNMKQNDLLEKDVDFDELAALTKNFTGAELEGLCNSATSFAINKYTKSDSMAQVDANIAKMRLTRNDFLLALNEVKPAFGVNEEDLTKNAPHGIIQYSPKVKTIFDKGQSFIDEVKSSETERLISILLHGPPGSGKTAIASTLALNSDFPFIKMLSAESLVGMSEGMKITTIDNIFRDIYKSPLNILVIDKIENLINYVPIGPRFSNDILQMLMVNLNKQPPNGRRLLIIGTTSQYSVLKHMNLVDCFTKTIGVGQVTSTDELMIIMTKIGFMNEHDRHSIVDQLNNMENPMGIGIKKLLQVLMNSKYLKADVNGVVENIIEAHLS